METEMKVVKEKEIVHDNEEKDYASKGVAGTGLGLGIAGTALGLWALSRNRGGLFGGGAGMPENVNINTVSEAIAGRTSGAPTAFQAWEKGCDDAIALTNAMWGLKVSSMQADYDHRQTDIAEKFSLWKSQVDADFGLYKTSRDLYDVLNERYGNKFNELDKKVAVLEATRPYQDRLIQCEIDKAFTAAINYADRLDCRNIKGIVGLPSTPTVTVLEGATCCRSRQPQAE
ncbi:MULTISPECIES: hypothetical protein [Butyricimonas]|uniref:hypothetical protein n=1 Tax=Butyricimonas TaxID=574697 RepID=UPI0007FB36C1|nr:MULTISPECIES: hypothetical protein [Butyricimonas]